MPPDARKVEMLAHRKPGAAGEQRHWRCLAALKLGRLTSPYVRYRTLSSEYGGVRYYSSYGSASIRPPARAPTRSREEGFLPSMRTEQRQKRQHLTGALSFNPRFEAPAEGRNCAPSCFGVVPDPTWAAPGRLLLKAFACLVQLVSATHHDQLHQVYFAPRVNA
jgi:hypothetical protein